MKIDHQQFTIVPDLSKPSLEGLAYILRHKELWPKNFKRKGWEFTDCSRCAMGLACRLWRIEDFDLATIAGEFNIRWEDAYKIFIVKGAEITPEIVARRIDEYLENREKENG